MSQVKSLKKIRSPIPLSHHYWEIPAKIHCHCGWCARVLKLRLLLSCYETVVFLYKMKIVWHLIQQEELKNWSKTEIVNKRIGQAKHEKWGKERALETSVVSTTSSMILKEKNVSWRGSWKRVCLAQGSCLLLFTYSFVLKSRTCTYLWKDIIAIGFWRGLFAFSKLFFVSVLLMEELFGNDSAFTVTSNTLTVRVSLQCRDKLYHLNTNKIM